MTTLLARMEELRHSRDADLVWQWALEAADELERLQNGSSRIVLTDGRVIEVPPGSDVKVTVECTGGGGGGGALLENFGRL